MTAMLRYCLYCKVTELRDLRANPELTEYLRTTVLIGKNLGLVGEELNIVFAFILENSREREAGSISQAE